MPVLEHLACRTFVGVEDVPGVPPHRPPAAAPDHPQALSAARVEEVVLHVQGGDAAVLQHQDGLELRLVGVHHELGPQPEPGLLDERHQPAVGRVDPVHAAPGKQRPDEHIARMREGLDRPGTHPLQGVAHGPCDRDGVRPSMEKWNWVIPIR